jgi:hypothetical protein
MRKEKCMTRQQLVVVSKMYSLHTVKEPGTEKGEEKTLPTSPPPD